MEYLNHPRVTYFLPIFLLPHFIYCLVFFGSLYIVMMCQSPFIYELTPLLSNDIIRYMFLRIVRNLPNPDFFLRDRSPDLNDNATAQEKGLTAKNSMFATAELSKLSFQKFMFLFINIMKTLLEALFHLSAKVYCTKCRRLLIQVSFVMIFIKMQYSYFLVWCCDVLHWKSIFSSAVRNINL